MSLVTSLLTDVCGELRATRLSRSCSADDDAPPAAQAPDMHQLLLAAQAQGTGLAGRRTLRPCPFLLVYDILMVVSENATIILNTIKILYSSIQHQ